MSIQTEQNKIAQMIANHFFVITEIKPTPAMFRTAIGQAKNLMDAGYNSMDIMKSIEYTHRNPPKKGFYSLGWLSYDIANVLNKVQIEEMKQANIKPIVESPIQDGSWKEFNQKKIGGKGMNKSFGLDLFGDKK